MLFCDRKNPWYTDELKMSEFDEMDRRIEEISASIDGDEMTVADAEIIRQELAFVIDLLKLSSKVGRMRLGGKKPEKLKAEVEKIKKTHKHVWLLRNRPGGLADSVKTLNIK